jgi:hypothetical protein
MEGCARGVFVGLRWLLRPTKLGECVGDPPLNRSVFGGRRSNELLRVKSPDGVGRRR